MLTLKAIDTVKTSIKSDYKPFSRRQADVLLVAIPVDLVLIPSPIQPNTRLFSPMETGFLLL